MFEFNESERAFLTEMRAITTDSKGREHLVGLSLEETEFYILHQRGFLTRHTRPRDDASRKRFLELHDRHELARLEVLGTEIAARNDKSPRH